MYITYRVIYTHRYACIHIHLHSYINLTFFLECRGRLSYLTVPCVRIHFVKYLYDGVSYVSVPSFSVLQNVLFISLLTGGLISLFLQPSPSFVMWSEHKQCFLLHVPRNWIHSVAPMKVKKMATEEFLGWILQKS